jgi:hypothetical protein
MTQLAVADGRDSDFDHQKGGGDGEHTIAEELHAGALEQSTLVSHGAILLPRGRSVRALLMTLVHPDGQLRYRPAGDPNLT